MAGSVCWAMPHIRRCNILRKAPAWRSRMRVCLTEALASTRGDLERGLEQYRTARLLRTARVQLGSRLLGDHVYHADGPYAMLRNHLNGQLNVESFCEKLSWLYEAPFPRQDHQGLMPRKLGDVMQQGLSAGQSQEIVGWRGKKCGRGTKPAFAPWLAKRDIGRVKAEGNLDRQFWDACVNGVGGVQKL